jgi:beta-ureidopropionase
MKVGFFQMDIDLLGVEANVNKALKVLENVQADLMVLPELFNSGYAFETKKEVEKTAEFIPGYTTEKLTETAADKNMTIVAGICEKKGDKFFNSAVYITEKRTEVYRKVHLFRDEKKFFSPGSVFSVYNSIGIMICFDYFFPEAARTLMLKGARLIAHPSNLVLPYCPDAMVQRSLENRVFSVTCNRVGKERGLTFIGQSQITDSKGDILYRSGTAEEHTIQDIDLEEADNKMITRRNNLLEDRRPEAYELS